MHPDGTRRVHTAVIGLLAFVLLSTACTIDGTAGGSATTTSLPSVMVQPNPNVEEIVINVALTDDGFDPETIFLPAGYPIRLVVKNRGTQEHHYRIAGLFVSNLGWYQWPEIGEDELLAMSPEELAELGMSGSIDDPAHIVHHLKPSIVPFKETSPAGIRPLGTEVHAYATLGKIDTVVFFPLNTGRFVVEDVLHPEITGTVVVFLP